MKRKPKIKKRITKKDKKCDRNAALFYFYIKNKQKNLTKNVIFWYRKIE